MTVTEVSAWPGSDPRTASTCRPPSSAITSPVLHPEPRPRAGLSSDGVVPGQLGERLGSSWSQPLLAYRPSQIVGSGRKTVRSPSPVLARGGGRAQVGDRLGLHCLARFRRPRPCMDRGLPECLEIRPLGRPVAQVVAQQIS